MQYYYIIFCIILFSSILFQYLKYIFTQFTSTITVKDKSIYSTGKRGSNLIYTTNGQIYKIHNSFLFLRFNGPNLLSKLEPNKTFFIQGYGFNLPQFGIYKTITSVVPA